MRTRKNVGELAAEITVAFGMPLQSKTDQIIDQCTQLGVRSFVPLITKKSPLRLSADKINKRTERWNQVAISSMKQSMRTMLPAVHLPMDVDELSRQLSRFDLVLLGSMKGKPLAEVSIPPGLNRIIMVTGPEQGFSRIEEDTLNRAGAIPVSLGYRRLRAELAPVVLVSSMLVRLQ